MGSDTGGKRAVAIYSLVETGKLNGLDPQAYLRDVFHELSTTLSTAWTSCCRGTSVETSRAPTCSLNTRQAARRGKTRLNLQGTGPNLIDALKRASTREVFNLSAINKQLLAVPRKIIDVRTNMNLGQTLRYLDWRDDQMRSGKVVAMKSRRSRCTNKARGAKGSCLTPLSNRRLQPCSVMPQLQHQRSRRRSRHPAKTSDAAKRRHSTRPPSLQKWAP